MSSLRGLPGARPRDRAAVARCSLREGTSSGLGVSQMALLARGPWEPSGAAEALCVGAQGEAPRAPGTLRPVSVQHVGASTLLVKRTPGPLPSDRRLSLVAPPSGRGGKVSCPLTPALPGVGEKAAA